MEAAGITREPIKTKWTKTKMLTEEAPYDDGTKEAESWIEEQMKILKGELKMRESIIMVEFRLKP